MFKTLLSPYLWLIFQTFQRGFLIFFGWWFCQFVLLFCCIDLILHIILYKNQKLEKPIQYSYYPLKCTLVPLIDLFFRNFQQARFYINTFGGKSQCLYGWKWVTSVVTLNLRDVAKSTGSCADQLSDLGKLFCYF